MTTQQKTTLVLGVDGSQQTAVALGYAVCEAQRLGAGLRLVHVVPQVTPMTPMMPLVGVETFAETGRKILADARKSVSAADGPAVPVESVLRVGGRVHHLIVAGEGATQIIVGHHSRSLAGRIFAASTANGLATRAHVPVVSVPETWTTDRVTGRVVVGVDDPHRSFEPLLRGFLAAAHRGARLTIVHGWRLQSPYDDLVVSRVESEEWLRSLEKHTEEALAPLKEDFPDVIVDIEVRHDFASPALIESSKDADLVVIGRHGHGAPFGFYLGSVARTLLRESHCPVEIVPLRAGADAFTEELEVISDELEPQF